MAGLTDLFSPANEQARDDAEERRKKLLAAARVGSPGKISTLMGYAGNLETQSSQ